MYKKGGGGNILGKQINKQNKNKKKGSNIGSCPQVPVVIPALIKPLYYVSHFLAFHV
jgi:hypothetical protein